MIYGKLGAEYLALAERLSRQIQAAETRLDKMKAMREHCFHCGSALLNIAGLVAANREKETSKKRPPEFLG